MAKTVAQLFCVSLYLLPVVYLLFSLLLLYLIRTFADAPISYSYSGRQSGDFDVTRFSTPWYTPEWYALVKAWAVEAGVGLSAVLVTYVFFSRRVWRFCERCVFEVSAAIRVMRAVFWRLGRREKTLLLGLFGVILVYRVYFFLTFPLHTDELASYLFFVRPGAWVTVTSYPIPNNHVLFNLCCWVIARIPVLSPKAVMRLPSIAGDLLVLYGLFCVFVRWDGFWRGFIVVAGVAFCYYTSYYAVQGRGYEWQVGCALVGLLSGLTCFVWPGAAERRGYALFVLSSVAGFYINPTFVYAFVALVLFAGYWLWRKRDVQGALLLMGGVGIIVGMVLLLYLPLILASSWHALVSNHYVTGAASYRELAGRFSEFTFILKDGSYYGRAGMYFALAFMVACFLLYRWRWIGGQFYVYAAGYLLAVAGALLLLIGYSRMYPLERGLCYWILGANVLFVNVVYDVVRGRFAPGRVVPVMMLFLAVKLAGSLRGLYWERWSIGQRKEVVQYYTIRRDLEQLGSLHPAMWQVTNSDDYYSMYVREYLIEREGNDAAVVLDGTKARGQVLFLPDQYRADFDLRGYTIWGDRRITVVGDQPADKTLSIYIVK